MNIAKKHYKTGLLLFILSSLVNPVYLLAQAPNAAYPTPQTYSTGTAIYPLYPVNTGGAVAVNGQTSTLVGSGLNQPYGAVVDQSGNIFVSDAGHQLIKKVTPAGVVTTFVGSGTAGSGNGTGTGASFNIPAGLCLDASGTLYVADKNNNMIRKISPGGVVTTLAGQVTAGFTDATGTAAKFNLPYGVAVDASGNVFVADYNNNVIRKITSAGVVSTFAGSTSGTAGSTNGTGTTARFNHPSGVAIDASGNLYVADRANNMIRKITSSGAVTTVAGSTTAGTTNGTTSAARFNLPTTVALDPSGKIYVADYTNNEIRVIDVSQNSVSTLSGSFDSSGLVNGTGAIAAFTNPFAIAADINGNLYVCDYGNNALRKVAYAPYSLTPYLTSGLSFNSTTGVISGTPLAVSSATNYTLGAYNASGPSTATVSITIIGLPLPKASPDQNYVLTYVPRVSGLTTSTAIFNASPDNTQVQTQVQYIDGLGRPLQNVQVAASPTAKDVVQPFAYDSESRDSVKYLPYSKTTSSPGSYQATAVKGAGGTYSSSDQYTFYQQTGQGYVNTTYPYACTAYEPSALNRPAEQGAPGTAWQLSNSGVSGGGHTVKLVYVLNNSTSFASDSVNGRQVAWYNATINSDGSRTLTANSYYPAGTLTVTISKDENWVSGRAGTVEEYKDQEGHVLLKRQYNYKNSAVEMLSTYYVYDDMNLLAFVLPPASGADAAGTISKTTLDNLCYQYRYDDRGRMSQKKIPGKGWEYTVYNYIDQPVATQDSLQRFNKQWIVTKYDGIGRPVTTAIWNNGNDTINQRRLQSNLTAIKTNLWETPVTTSSYYTNVAWPTTSIVNTLSLDWYDNYNISGLPYAGPSGKSVQTRGLATAKKTAVLNTPTDQLWDVIYYDDLGRTLKTFTQHYLGGTVNTNNYDAATTTYNFTNQPTTVTRQHWNTASTANPLVTIANTYLYDQIGRKIKTWEQITNGNNIPTTKTLVSKTDYNEIGQVLNKHLHSTDSVNFLQNTTYTYTERGWLWTSSAPLFAMTLYYNQSSGNKAYNGNIVYQYWGTPGSLGTLYNYAYDKLNRLLYGVMELTPSGTILNAEQGISYDQMGNMTLLIRAIGSTQFDHLAYTYTGNQLQSVFDNTGSNSGLVAGTTNYTYDGNGNMLTDTNSVNTSQNKTITYNLLNLPQTIKVQHGMVTYTYDATGNKLRKVSVLSGVTKTTDYISGIEYDGGTTDTLNFIQTEEGKAAKYGSIYDYQYYLGDNLGNTRVTFGTKTGSAVAYQKDDYYPFGLEINNSLTGAKNEYLYNKKELQEETQEYDYGARFYDPLTGKWTTIDPLAEESRRWSSYNYVEDNPVRLTDPDGMQCDPCDVEIDEEGNVNGMSIVENVFYSTRDAVTSGVLTLVSGAKSLFGGAPMQQASFDYSSGQRTLNYYKLPSTSDKLAATGNSLLGLASLLPTDGPAAGIFAKTSGVKSSVAEVIKDAVHANSKLSKAENTLYKLETKSGEYLKTGVTSKPIIEKRYTAAFMKDKRMVPLKKGSRANMLKKERKIVEKNPGLLNKEPWAGKKKS